MSTTHLLLFSHKQNMKSNFPWTHTIRWSHSLEQANKIQTTKTKHGKATNTDVYLNWNGMDMHQTLGKHQPSESLMKCKFVICSELIKLNNLELVFTTTYPQVTSLFILKRERQITDNINQLDIYHNHHLSFL